MNFKEISMIEPQTDAGKNLKETYDKKIEAVETDTGAFPRSGQGSKAEIINGIKGEYNEMLPKLEEVTFEKQVAANRRQMKEATTLAGKQLKINCYEQILHITNDTEGTYARSGPKSQAGQIDALIIQYNLDLAKFES